MMIDGKTLVQLLMKYYGQVAELELTSGAITVGCITDMNIQTATLELISVTGDMHSIPWSELVSIGKPGAAQRDVLRDASGEEDAAPPAQNNTDSPNATILELRDARRWEELLTAAKKCPEEIFSSHELLCAYALALSYLCPEDFLSLAYENPVVLHEPTLAERLQEAAKTVPEQDPRRLIISAAGRHVQCYCRREQMAPLERALRDGDLLFLNRYLSSEGEALLKDEGFTETQIEYILPRLERVGELNLASDCSGIAERFWYVTGNMHYLAETYLWQQFAAEPTKAMNRLMVVLGQERDPGCVAYCGTEPALCRDRELQNLWKFWAEYCRKHNLEPLEAASSPQVPLTYLKSLLRTDPTGSALAWAQQNIEYFTNQEKPGKELLSVIDQLVEHAKNTDPEKFRHLLQICSTPADQRKPNEFEFYVLQMDRRMREFANNPQRLEALGYDQKIIGRICRNMERPGAYPRGNDAASQGQRLMVLQANTNRMAERYLRKALKQLQRNPNPQKEQELKRDLCLLLGQDEGRYSEAVAFIPGKGALESKLDSTEFIHFLRALACSPKPKHQKEYNLWFERYSATNAAKTLSAVDRTDRIKYLLENQRGKEAEQFLTASLAECTPRDWRNLQQILAEHGLPELCLRVLETLVNRTPRVDPTVLYQHFLPLKQADSPVFSQEEWELFEKCSHELFRPLAYLFGLQTCTEEQFLSAAETVCQTFAQEDTDWLLYLCDKLQEKSLADSHVYREIIHRLWQSAGLFSGEYAPAAWMYRAEKVVPLPAEFDAAALADLSAEVEKAAPAKLSLFLDNYPQSQPEKAAEPAAIEPPAAPAEGEDYYRRALDAIWEQYQAADAAGNDADAAMYLQILSRSFCLDHADPPSLRQVIRERAAAAPSMERWLFALLAESDSSVPFEFIQRWRNISAFYVKGSDISLPLTMYGSDAMWAILTNNKAEKAAAWQTLNRLLSEKLDSTDHPQMRRLQLCAAMDGAWRWELLFADCQDSGDQTLLLRSIIACLPQCSDFDQRSKVFDQITELCQENNELVRSFADALYVALQQNYENTPDLAAWKAIKTAHHIARITSTEESFYQCFEKEGHLLSREAPMQSCAFLAALEMDGKTELMEQFRAELMDRLHLHEPPTDIERIDLPALLRELYEDAGADRGLNEEEMAAARRDVLQLILPDGSIWSVQHFGSYYCRRMLADAPSDLRVARSVLTRFYRHSVKKDAFLSALLFYLNRDLGDPISANRHLAAVVTSYTEKQPVSPFAAIPYVQMAVLHGVDDAVIDNFCSTFDKDDPFRALIEEQRRSLQALDPSIKNALRYTNWSKLLEAGISSTDESMTPRACLSGCNDFKAMESKKWHSAIIWNSFFRGIVQKLCDIRLDSTRSSADFESLLRWTKKDDNFQSSLRKTDRTLPNPRFENIHLKAMHPHKLLRDFSRMFLADAPEHRLRWARSCAQIPIEDSQVFSSLVSVVLTPEESPEELEFRKSVLFTISPKDRYHVFVSPQDPVPLLLANRNYFDYLRDSAIDQKENNLFHAISSAFQYPHPDTEKNLLNWCSEYLEKYSGSFHQTWIQYKWICILANPDAIPKMSAPDFVSSMAYALSYPKRVRRLAPIVNKMTPAQRLAWDTLCYIICRDTDAFSQTMRALGDPESPQENALLTAIRHTLYITKKNFPAGWDSSGLGDLWEQAQRSPECHVSQGIKFSNVAEMKVALAALEKNLSADSETDLDSAEKAELGIVETAEGLFASQAEYQELRSKFDQDESGSIGNYCLELLAHYCTKMAGKEPLEALLANASSLLKRILSAQSGDSAAGHNALNALCALIRTCPYEGLKTLRYTLNDLSAEAISFADEAEEKRLRAVLDYLKFPDLAASAAVLPEPEPGGDSVVYDPAGKELDAEAAHCKKCLSDIHPEYDPFCAEHPGGLIRELGKLQQSKVASQPRISLHLYQPFLFSREHEEFSTTHLYGWVANDGGATFSSVSLALTLRSKTDTLLSLNYSLQEMRGQSTRPQKAPLPCKASVADVWLPSKTAAADIRLRSKSAAAESWLCSAPFQLSTAIEDVDGQEAITATVELVAASEAGTVSYQLRDLPLSFVPDSDFAQITPRYIRNVKDNSFFFGRTEELKALEDAYLNSDAPPKLYLITGQYRMGKTFLTRRFGDMLRQRFREQLEAEKESGPSDAKKILPIFFEASDGASLEETLYLNPLKRLREYGFSSSFDEGWYQTFRKKQLEYWYSNNEERLNAATRSLRLLPEYYEALLNALPAGTHLLIMIDEVTRMLAKLDQQDENETENLRENASNNLRLLLQNTNRVSFLFCGANDLTQYYLNSFSQFAQAVSLDPLVVKEMDPSEWGEAIRGALNAPLQLDQWENRSRALEELRFFIGGYIHHGLCSINQLPASVRLLPKTDGKLILYPSHIRLCMNRVLESYPAAEQKNDQAILDRLDMRDMLSAISDEDAAGTAASGDAIWRNSLLCVFRRCAIPYQWVEEKAVIRELNPEQDPELSTRIRNSLHHLSYYRAILDTGKVNGERVYRPASEACRQVLSRPRDLNVPSCIVRSYPMFIEEGDL